MRTVTNPRESTLLTRESSCKRSGAQAQFCMAAWRIRIYVAARSRASEVLSWHFIHTLLDLQFAAVLLRACFALAG